MASDITMPALSPTMEEGTLLKWHVQAGDKVSAGDVIAEIETDKATMEVEAIDDGLVTEILVPEGTESVKVNSVIARFQSDDEDAGDSAKTPAKAEAAAKPPAAESDNRQSRQGRMESERVTEKDSAAGNDAAKAEPPARPASAAKAEGSPARTAASPLARRLARELGVDLDQVTGTGPRGRIVKADIEAAVAAGEGKPAPAQPAGKGEDAAPARAAPEPAVSASSASEAAASPGAPPYESIRLSAMRKTIARRLTQSKQEVPHYYLTVDVRLDKLLELRGKLNRALESQRLRLSVNDLLIKALALALIRVPEANVSYMGDHMRQFSRADISVAVAIPGGLITPVIRNADSKRLSQISADMRDLGGRAKDGRLKPEEYSNGTASISNLGMFGIREFSAVINPPEGLILAVGAAEKRAIVVDDEIQIATVMSATGSFDHRAIDGAVGAKFLSAFKELVENPIAMLA